MTTTRDDIARRQNRLVKAVEEALSVAKGEKPSASIYVNGHKYVPATQLDSLLKERDALQARVKELEALVYVPGSWHCPKCKFTLLQSNLNAQDGTITARDTPGDKCPNCNGPLWRCSWKNDAFEMQERAVEQMERAKAAESRALRAEQERDEAVTFIRKVTRDSYLDDYEGKFMPTSIAKEAEGFVRQLAAGNEKEGE